MKKLLLAAGLASAIGFTACNDVNIYKLEAHQGAFILNQGTSNGSISYYNYERQESTNNIYTAIGSGATTIAIHKNSDFPKGIAYVAVPTDNSIELINLDGYKSAGTIEVFTNPTDLLITGVSTICVAHEGNSVSVYDLESNKIIKTYEVTEGPQKLITSGKFLYVACKGDGTGAKVEVIDLSNEVKVDLVDLAYNEPIDMVVDIDRKVWVYCNGNEQALVKLDREFVTEKLDEGLETERDTTYVTNNPVDFALGTKLIEASHPLTISRDGRSLYYVYGNLCSNSVYIEPGTELSKSSVVVGDYADTGFNGVDYDSRRGRLMALTTDGELVVLRRYDEGWKNEEVYEVGEKPVMSAFNF